MTWCEYTGKCKLYKRDEEALGRLKEDYGEGHLVYKIALVRLENLCNHKHLLCKDRLKFKREN